jgi:hypothetical protein
MPPSTCAVCEAPIPPGSGREGYCSEACRDRAYYLAHRDRELARHRENQRRLRAARGDDASRLTPEQLAAIAAAPAGMTAAELARGLGIGHRVLAVRRARRRLALAGPPPEPSARHRTPWALHEDHRVLTDASPARDLAAELGRSINTIRRRRRWLRSHPEAREAALLAGANEPAPEPRGEGETTGSTYRP